MAIKKGKGQGPAGSKSGQVPQFRRYGKLVELKLFETKEFLMWVKKR